MIKKINKYKHVILFIIAGLILIVDGGLLFVLRKDIAHNNEISSKKEEYVLLQNQIKTYNKLLNDYNTLVLEDGDLETRKKELETEKEKLIQEEDKLTKEIEKLKKSLG